MNTLILLAGAVLILAGCQEAHPGMAPAEMKAALDECTRHGLKARSWSNLHGDIIKVTCAP